LSEWFIGQSKIQRKQICS